MDPEEPAGTPPPPEIVTEESLEEQGLVPPSSPGRRGVLDRLRDEYWEGLHAPPGEELPLEQVAMLRFRLDEAAYAFELGYCQSILRAPPLSRIPRSPPELAGVLAYRGEVFPVVDLRALLGLPERRPDRRSRAILLAVPGCTGAVVVDRVETIEEVVGPLPAPPDDSFTMAEAHPELGRVLSVPALLALVLDRLDPQEVA